MIVAFTGPFSVAADGVFVFAMSTAGGVVPPVVDASTSGPVLGDDSVLSGGSVLQRIIGRL